MCMYSPLVGAIVSRMNNSSSSNNNNADDNNNGILRAENQDISILKQSTDLNKNPTVTSNNSNNNINQNAFSRRRSFRKYMKRRGK